MSINLSSFALCSKPSWTLHFACNIHYIVPDGSANKMADLKEDKLKRFRLLLRLCEQYKFFLFIDLNVTNSMVP